MGEHRLEAGSVEPYIWIEVSDLLEHRHRLVDFVEGRGFDLDPRFAQRRDAEQHGITEPCRDVEHLVGVGEPLIERRREARRLGRVQQDAQEGDLVTEPAGARDRFVGQREPPLPLAALRELERERGEQPGPLGTVVRSDDLEGPFERRDTSFVDAPWTAGAAAVVRERGADQCVAIADAVGQGGRVEQGLAECVRIGPTLRAAERDEEIDALRIVAFERVERDCVPPGRLLG